MCKAAEDEKLTTNSQESGYYFSKDATKRALPSSTGCKYFIKRCGDAIIQSRIDTSGTHKHRWMILDADRNLQQVDIKRTIYDEHKKWN